MIFNLPPPPVSNDPKDPAFRDWFYKLRQAFAVAGSIAWTSISGTPTTLAGYGITSPLDIAEGGTGLSTLGTANQVLAVNAGATALEYQTVSSSGFGPDVLAFAAAHG